MDDIFRLLSPSDYDILKEAVGKYKYQFLLDTMLNTGMRYSELLRLKVNIESWLRNPKKVTLWFKPKHNLIKLPSEATKTKDYRNVLLTREYSAELNKMIEIAKGLNGKGENNFKVIPFSSYPAMDGNLTRWAEKAGIDEPYNLAIKTMRKTWESWLVTAEKPLIKIMKSQGHTNAIALEHYYNSGFSQDDVDEIKRRVVTWGL